MKIHSASIQGGNLVIDDGEQIYVIHPAMIASYGELLGFDDALDAVDAVLHVEKYGLLDDDHIDKGTQEHALTEPWILIQHQEQLREEAAVKAEAERKEGRDPRRPRLRATLAVAEARKDPASPEAHIGACQKRARDTLGVPDPDCNPQVVRAAARGVVAGREKTFGFSCDSAPHTVETDEKRRELGEGCREKLREILEPNLDALNRLRAAFCHRRTTLKDDPLWEPDDRGIEARDRSKGPSEPPSLDDVLARYRKEAA